MATLNASLGSLIDVTKRMRPDGSIETNIAELLTQDNEVLFDMQWKEGNLATGHRLTMRTGLPAGTWRKFNQGVASTKSTTVQVDEACGMYEQKGSIDKDLAMLNGGTADFRMTENVAHMQAMNNDMATALFYADNTTPEKFIGLTPRYNSLSAGNAQNILAAGGAGADNTSVWLLGWGEQGLYGIYPKGSLAGLQHMPVKDGSADGCVEMDDGTNTGATYRAFVDRYQWKCGLAIKNWQYAVRIANVDVSDLIAQTGTQASTAATDILKLMSRAIDRIPSAAGVKLAFYMNRTVFSILKLKALDKSNAALSIEDALLQFGDFTVKSKQVNFLGIPIRKCDAITLGEGLAS
jgi:hypothetical protein